MAWRRWFEYPRGLSNQNTAKLVSNSDQREGFVGYLDLPTANVPASPGCTYFCSSAQAVRLARRSSGVISLTRLLRCDGVAVLGVAIADDLLGVVRGWRWKTRGVYVGEGGARVLMHVLMWRADVGWWLASPSLYIDAPDVRHSMNDSD